MSIGVAKPDWELAADIADMLDGMNPAEAAAVVCEALNHVMTVRHGFVAGVVYRPAAKIEGSEG